MWSNYRNTWKIVPTKFFVWVSWHNLFFINIHHSISIDRKKVQILFSSVYDSRTFSSFFFFLGKTHGETERDKLLKKKNQMQLLMLILSFNIHIFMEYLDLFWRLVAQSILLYWLNSCTVYVPSRSMKMCCVCVCFFFRIKKLQNHEICHCKGTGLLYYEHFKWSSL